MTTCDPLPPVIRNCCSKRSSNGHPKHPSAHQIRQVIKQKLAYLDNNCIPRLTNTICNTELACPSSVLRHVKSDRAQSRIMESPEPVARHWSTGENWTHHTPRLWPRNVPSKTRSERRHILRDDEIYYVDFTKHHRGADGGIWLANN
jgi:hypothetical protein